ncbi:TPA: hypothetical protein KDZ97_003692 [Vibrio parahaemolyticus]|uniref:hypothetical protein n=1 Tax=Vibrio parahaemolyticus TaxID=670 RepID=UPI001B83E1B0|nr:hypothetical protein [Vibrio parahaemolyticus]MDF5646612.1 hypothetical protein [Vibrio parahaemolyticus]MDF5666130.1 hypothetical protein [Vibrio parahaemolyticus]WKV19382.1 hypothetical protein [Vibrio parahaemolyticus]HBC3539158.1 hypothetical protein [Vibrio parahaemolyticus]HBC3815599.1 hypothetical protein [Vibrio parahaemolyticus]
MKCNHVVASVGGKFIVLGDIATQYREWSAQVEDFNEKNRTHVVTPPPEFKFAKYCMNCGEKINQDAVKTELRGGDESR